MQLYKQHLITLLLADRVGPVFVYRALAAHAGINNQSSSDVIAYYAERYDILENALEDILRADADFFARHGVCALGPAEKVVKAFKDVDLARELELIEREGVSIDTCFDPEYPQLLKNIYAPPVVLYRKGDPVRTEAPALAVVGSRSATSYGLECTEMLLPPVIRSGCTVVSGGAVGIDTRAHELALEDGGATVVVLGSGLLHPYPSSNKDLFEVIAGRGGTVLSPFSMEQRPERGTFPARNRVIAGIADVCLVIEASAKSGALITASYALESGRTVCAVPGPITSDTSAGCNGLLRQGAVVICCSADLLQELGCPEVPEMLPQVEEIPFAQRSELVQEREILKFLAHFPRSEEEIVEFMGKNAQEVQIYLFDLQLEGKIQQQFTGLWGLPTR